MRKLAFLLFAFSFFCSCIPSKDLVYLQGEPLSKKEIHRINNIPYKLQVNDIIIIDIKAADNNLVALFNKNQTNGTNEQSQNGGGYFSGFTVDTHGNIRVPYIGEINVLGYTTKEVRIKVEDEFGKVV